MRLKENSDSWRAGAIEKRDFKHDHNESPISFRSRKNTNKWCRGKIGIQHSMQWQKEVGFFGHIYMVGICGSCGKHMFGRA